MIYLILACTLASTCPERGHRNAEIMSAEQCHAEAARRTGDWLCVSRLPWPLSEVPGRPENDHHWGY